MTSRARHRSGTYARQLADTRSIQALGQSSMPVGSLPMRSRTRGERRQPDRGDDHMALHFVRAILVGTIAAASVACSATAPSRAPSAISGAPSQAPSATSGPPSQAPSATLAAAASPTSEPASTTEPATAPPGIVPIDLATAHWSKIADISLSPAWEPSRSLVGSGAAGYAVLTINAIGDATNVRFSVDGTHWATTVLGNQVKNCPGWGPPGDEKVNDAVARAIATNGREFVVVGEEHLYDATSCANGGFFRPVAWLSRDGRTWSRSDPLGRGPRLRATAVWATPTGWRAMGVNTLWESTDGL